MGKPIFGKYRFRPQQRVRPSAEGIAANLFLKKHEHASGVVVKVDHWNCPTVLWDHRKTASHYFADFIMPDRRKSKP